MDEAMGITGRIFDISRGCVSDGPGLRTVVFLKGCRLDCQWCQNFEGKSFAPEIAFDPRRCIDCGRCRQTCSAGARGACTACGRCASVCPAAARKVVGQDYGVGRLLEGVLVDADFFQGTGGGVTFSGGEPLAQSGFVLACAEALRACRVHVAVETAGFWDPELADEVARHFDLVLFDLKHVDAGKFSRAVGQNNRLVLHNLAHLLATDIALELRITLVPGMNDSEADLRAIVAWLGQCPRLPPVRLLPFHSLAGAKPSIGGRTYPYSDVPAAPSRGLVRAAEQLRAAGIRVTEGASAGGCSPSPAIPTTLATQWPGP